MSTVTLEAAKVHLNFTDLTDDEELQDFLDRAETAIGNDVALGVASRTEWVRGHGSALWLSYAPVVSLTSVTSIDGTTVPVGALTVLDGGQVEYTRGYFSSRLYSVAYQAGWSTLPDDLQLAVLEKTRRLWSTQRHLWSDGGRFSAIAQGSGSAPPMSAPRDDDIEKLIAPYRTPNLA